MSDLLAEAVRGHLNSIRDLMDARKSDCDIDDCEQAFVEATGALVALQALTDREAQGECLCEGEPDRKVDDRGQAFCKRCDTCLPLKPPAHSEKVERPDEIKFSIEGKAIKGYTVAEEQMARYILSLEKPRVEGTRRERDRIKTLEKRAKYLEARIKNGDANGKDLTFDKQEASAIRWACDALRQSAGIKAREGE